MPFSLVGRVRKTVRAPFDSRRRGSPKQKHACELRTTEETAAADAVMKAELNAFDDTEWILRLVEYVQRMLKHDRIRVIGVCYGHQIVGRALGVKVARSDAWEISVSEVRLTPKGKQIFEKDVLVCPRL